MLAIDDEHNLAFGQIACEIGHALDHDRRVAHEQLAPADPEQRAIDALLALVKQERLV